jgi:cell division protein ZipA
MNPAIGLAWNPAVGIPMLFVGIVVLVLIWLFGQPRKEQQGRRKPMPEGQERSRERREPVFNDDGEEVGEAGGESFSARDDRAYDTRDEREFSARDDDANDPLFRPTPKQGELDVDLRAELERLGASLSGDRAAIRPPEARDEPASPAAPQHSPPQRVEPRFDLPFDLDEPVAAAPAPAPVRPSAPAPAPVPAPAPPPKAPPRSDLGRRPSHAPVERIVSLYVVAREGSKFHGSDLVVAAEKAGLEFGDMGIYHRLVDGHPEQGPIFSVANLTKPGNFDMGRIATLQTSGLSFFMALPGPAPALDAWDAMLPTAQRLAELLDGLVLDEERNALGRQRIAHIRDELRGWDRGHEGEEIKFGQ